MLSPKGGRGGRKEDRRGSAKEMKRRFEFSERDAKRQKVGFVRSREEIKDGQF